MIKTSRLTSTSEKVPQFANSEKTKLKKSFKIKRFQTGPTHVLAPKGQYIFFVGLIVESSGVLGVCSCHPQRDTGEVYNQFEFVNLTLYSIQFKQFAIRIVQWSKI